MCRYVSHIIGLIIDNALKCVCVYVCVIQEVRFLFRNKQCVYLVMYYISSNIISVCVCGISYLCVCAYPF